jgi:dTMP kinase
MVETTPRRKQSGIFITLEGGEGAGKTTQAQLLRQRLEQLGHKVVLTREPGGTRLGEKLRDIILRPSAKTRQGSSQTSAPPIIGLTPRSGLEPEVELLLILAARAQLVAEVIRPALERGEIVICDRYSDSTLAYQGYGRGLNLEAVEEANKLATGGLRPHLPILLELPVDIGLARKVRGTEWDSIGQESREFHQRVHAGFRELVAREPERWLVVDAALPPEEAGKRIWERVERLIDEPASG